LAAEEAAPVEKEQQEAAPAGKEDAADEDEAMPAAAEEAAPAEEEQPEAAPAGKEDAASEDAAMPAAAAAPSAEGAAGADGQPDKMQLEKEEAPLSAAPAAPRTAPHKAAPSAAPHTTQPPGSLQPCRKCLEKGIDFKCLPSEWRA